MTVKIVYSLYQKTNSSNKILIFKSEKQFPKIMHINSSTLYINMDKHQGSLVVSR